MFFVKDLQLRVHQIVASLSVQLVPRCHDSTVHGKIHDFCCRSQGSVAWFQVVLMKSCFVLPNIELVAVYKSQVSRGTS